MHPCAGGLLMAKTPHRLSTGMGARGTTRLPLRRSLTQLATARMISLGASTVGALIVSRAVSPGERGVISLSTTVASTAVLLFTCGLPAAITWQIGRGLRPGSMRSTLSLLTVVPPVGALAGLLMARELIESSYTTLPLALVLLATAATSLRVGLGAVLTGLRSYRTLANMTTTLALLTALLTAVAALITGSAEWTVAASTVAAFVAAGGFAAVVRREWRKSGDRAPGSVRERWRFGLLSWAANIVQEANFRFDILLIGLIKSPREVGIYAVAVATAQMLWVLPTAAGEIAFAESSRTGDGGNSRFLELTGPYLWLLTLASAGAAVALWIAAPLLVDLAIGPAYSAAVTPLRWLLPGVAGFCVVHVGANALAGLGRVGLNMMISLVTVIVTIGGDLWLIPRGGAKAAAAVSSASYLIAMALTVILIVAARRHIRSLGASAGGTSPQVSTPPVLG